MVDWKFKFKSTKHLYRCDNENLTLDEVSKSDFLKLAEETSKYTFEEQDPVKINTNDLEKLND